MSGLAFKLAKDNIKRNKSLYTPFILSTTGIITLTYIVNSLAHNESLMATYAGNFINNFLMIGTTLIIFFAVIFLFYSNSFIVKKRQSEIGLFNVLGLAKRDIVKVLFIETFIVYVIPLLSGLALGIVFEKLAFLIILKLLGVDVIFGFDISLITILGTVIFFSILFVGLFAYSAICVYRTDPIKLLKSKEVGEKEPKAKWLIALLGVVFMVIGYYFANIDTDVMTSLGIFFPAVFCVIIGTYLLFTAGSIAILKALKKNKRYYYKTSHFIATSNLMYRMKKNAVGLASITIMATMILVMTSSTTSMWFSLEHTSDRLYPKDFKIEITDPEASDDLAITKIDEGLKTIDNKAQDFTIFNSTSFYGRIEDDEVLIEDAYYSNKDSKEFQAIGSHDYEHLTGEKLRLADDEVIIYYEKDGYDKAEISFGDKTFKVKELVKGNIDLLPDSNLLDDSGQVTFVFSDLGVLNDQVDVHRTYLFDTLKPIAFTENFNYDYLNDLRESFSDVGVSILAKVDFEASLKSMYAAFLFLGTFLGLTFMLSIILIMYYKQISEGDEDSERYKIMKKVGLSDKEIKKTIDAQVVFVFFAPLIVSIIHLLGSCKMVSSILTALSQSNTDMYFYTMTMTTLAFVLFYVIVYLLTKKTYYRLITR